jgi:hypothetical protein
MHFLCTFYVYLCKQLENKTKMKENVILESPFWYELEIFISSNGAKAVVNVNGKPMPVAYYNLIVGIQQVKLHNKGIIINKGFNTKQLKEYFGFKGKDNSVFLEYLEDLLSFFKNEMGAKEKMYNKWGIMTEDDYLNLETRLN